MRRCKRLGHTIKAMSADMPEQLRSVSLIALRRSQDDQPGKVEMQDCWTLYPISRAALPLVD